jgi:ribose transport system substrate-binding protein/inositol transport system substrate-binding protein
MAEQAAKGEAIKDVNFIPFQLVTPQNYEKFMTP